MAFMAVGLLAFTGCDPARETPVPVVQVKSNRIGVVNHPLGSFVTRLAGADLEVWLPVPQDTDPAHWVPDSEAMKGYQACRVVFANGAGYARWLEWAPIPASAVVNTGEPFRSLWIRESGHITHQHGPEGKHDHGAWAFTTWMDFSLALRQMTVVADELTRLFPDRRESIRVQQSLLEQRFQDWHKRLSQVMAGVSNRSGYASHPVYQYFARAYGMDLHAFHWEPNEMPDPSEWETLQKLQEKQSRSWMLWEEDPGAEIAERLAAVGVEVLVFPPMGAPDADRDFLETLERSVQRLEAFWAEKR